MRIAKHLQVHHTTVSARLRRSGVKIRPRSFPKYPISRDTLQELYVRQKLSAPAVAKKLNVSNLAVYDHLKKYKMARPAGSVRKDETFDKLRPGRSIRVSLIDGKPAVQVIYAKARARGYKISIKKIDECTLSVLRLQTPKGDDTARIEEIKRLYYKEKWRVSKIATKLGLSDTHVFRIMRRAGMQLKERGKKDPVKRINKHKLMALYVRQHQSVPEIAQTLGVEIRDVIRELDRHGIWKGAREPSRFDFPELATLGLWEEVIVNTGKVGYSSKLGREIMWHNIRIVVRHTDSTWCRLLRTPFITPEAVQELLDQGVSPTRITKKLHADPRVMKSIFTQLGR